MFTDGQVFPGAPETKVLMVATETTGETVTLVLEVTTVDKVVKVPEVQLVLRVTL